MHTGVKIKIARITKGYTQEQLAEKINKTRPLVSHIEQTGKVNAYTLKKICEVLDIRPSDLENEVYEPHTHYHTDNATSEIKRLKEEIAILKDLVSMQKEVIMELKEKRQPKKKIKGA